MASLLARQAQPPQLQQGVRPADPARFSILSAQCGMCVLHDPVCTVWHVCTVTAQLLQPQQEGRPTDPFRASTSQVQHPVCAM